MSEITRRSSALLILAIALVGCATAMVCELPVEQPAERPSSSVSAVSSGGSTASAPVASGSAQVVASAAVISATSSTAKGPPVDVTPSGASSAPQDRVYAGEQVRGPSTVREPTVVQHTTDLSRRTSGGDYATVVRRSGAKVRDCYMKALANDPNLSGKLVLRATIGPNGAVTSVAEVASETTLKHPELVTCVKNVFKSMSFDAPAGGGTSFVYPLTFSPG